MSERLDLQPGEVTLRHVKLASSWGSYTHGPSVTVGGQSYAPGLRKDVAFTDGDYTRRMWEEGDFNLTFPNAPGPDGQENRERFLITTRGKVTPQAGGVLVYTGGAFRPGDEFIEVYRGVNDLLFVAVPLRAVLTPESVVLSGADARWLGKKSRETAAGFWSHAPRDVFENFTQSWRALNASDFSDASTFTGGTGASGGTSPDGVWIYTWTTPTPDGRGLRVSPPIGTSAVVEARNVAANQFESGSQSNLYWRGDAEVYLAKPLTGSGDTISLRTKSPGADSPQLNFFGDHVDMLSGSTFIAKRGAPLLNAGNHRLTIEGRGRWVYFYLDGQLLGDAQPREVTSQSGTYVSVVVGSSDTQITCDVRVLMTRVQQPFLMAGSAKGDYHLPGSPTPGGLIGSYFQDQDLKLALGSSTSAQFFASQLAPTRKPVLRRLDTAVNMPSDENAAYAAPTWNPLYLPSDIGGTAACSTRWVGSIYLDLSNYDYALRVAAGLRAKVYVGRTRFGEEMLTLTSESYSSPVTGTWLKAGSSAGSAPSGTSGFFNGKPSGWYPIIVEWGMGSTDHTAGIQVSAQRSDQVGLWTPIGDTGWGLMTRQGASLTRYFPLNDVGKTTAARDMSPNAVNGAYQAGYNVCEPNSPWPGGLAMGVGGAYAQVYAQFGNVPITANRWSVDVWVKRKGTSITAGTVLAKENVLLVEIRESDKKILGYVGTGAAFGGSVVGPAVTDESWYHVVLTYDGSNVRLYVNGVAYGPTADATGGTNGNTLWLGMRSDSSNALNGAVGHVGVHDRVIGASEVVSRYNGGRPPVPVTPLSPIGVHESQVRYESHYDQLAALKDSFGYQFTCEPMQLESGEFPGRIVPKVKVGRVTDYMLDDQEASSPQDAITAEDVCDALLCDAQGLADPGGASQLTLESFNFTQAMAHAFLHQEYISKSEITIEALLKQRLVTELALRGSPFEEVSGNPVGRRQLRDSFPLTGALAEFAWSVGDALRLKFPRLSVDDTAPNASGVQAGPRQILGVKWPLTPAGVGHPEVTFKQRPRDTAQAVRDILRTALAPQRNYQLQFVERAGALGASSTSWAPDAYSRVALPDDLSQLVSAKAVVISKSDVSAWTLEVMGTAVGSIYKTGEIDISSYLPVAKSAGYTGGYSTTAQSFYARLVAIGGTSTGSWQIQVVLTLKR